MTKELMDKAEKALASARLLLKADDSDGAVNRAYSAMFDGALAALSWAGIRDHHKTWGGLIGSFGPAAVNGVVQWMASRIAMRFSGERGVTERRDQMAAQMSHRMWCDQQVLLFGIMGDPRGFGESGMPRGIELNLALFAGVDEIADGAAVPLPLTVRQGESRRLMRLGSWGAIPRRSEFGRRLPGPASLAGASAAIRRSNTNRAFT
jgi:hypothetical protein